MKRVFAAAAIAAALCTLAGCYIGKAEFKGEDMKMYPFFGTFAVPTESGRACPCWGRRCPLYGGSTSPVRGFGFDCMRV